DSRTKGNPEFIFVQAWSLHGPQPEVCFRAKPACLRWISTTACLRVRGRAATPAAARVITAMACSADPGQRHLLPCLYHRASARCCASPTGGRFSMDGSSLRGTASAAPSATCALDSRSLRLGAAKSDLVELPSRCVE